MATKPTDIPAVVPVPKTPGEIAVEAAEAKAAAVVKETVSAELMTKVYRVLNDGIIAGDDKQAMGINVLTGIVTRADIENSGADFAWLLRVGAIEEAGYR